ncbi:uncharacterized protein E0L32_010147 [Thyridium curvatum]|uniref:Uncharacterized protein n=1 Tax=Thyridium curvatum TaxID=1093900 RepID=A0A507AME0_9PEZI|nr:uncharacterized protein E0L32_010147 [Thyridium curvatum]TPX08417.1 hypothetical protein E0L32_010147 [Thyridium curvatum]
MDLSSSSASTLTRPRITLAILTAAAAASVGLYILREARAASSHPEGSQGGRLHRSNAVRRPRRRSQAHERRESNASSYTSVESHGDENIDLGLAQAHTDGETVVDEPIDDSWWDDPTQLEAHRAGQNIVSLLFRVSEDNARRNAYVHRGCACNACGIVPIRGIRYRCANCADFDLCETCESQGLHIKTHIFYKVKIPAPPFGPRQMQPVWYPGDPDTCLRSLPKSLMIKLSRDTGFERPELEAFWEQWTFMANTEWREDPDDLYLAMDRKTFERCLVPSGGYRHTAPNLIHERMFSFYDTNNDDLIGFTEFLHGLSYRKRKDKLRKIFDGYDVDRDGLITRRDFLRIFRAYYVLYKQMHKDILEGLDDQVMSSSEAHQLVSSRQPLSSLFGREGRVPQAEHGRHLEGKIYHSNGDVELSDAHVRVVGEDKPDTSDRADVLARLFSRSGHRSSRLFPDRPYASERSPSPATEADLRYWETLLDPPTSIQELPAVLMGDNPVLDEIFANGDEEHHHLGDHDAAGVHVRRSVEVQDAHEHDPEAVNAHVGAEHDENADNVNGIASNSRQNDHQPTESEILAQHQAILAHSQSRSGRMNSGTRKQARRRIYERWQRRQFYLDEEEGAVAPPGWDVKQDILRNESTAAESSKAAQQHVLSPRSRSSSKVRFAEDPDEYEIRSNPSTSSRSVPERWGGIDIPEAERDAGKEILYQVTQQAFNELLDILFKAKEDLAIQAAETSAQRDKYRHLFENLDLTEGVDDAGQPEDETLKELLNRSGYTIQRPASWTPEEEDMPELEVIEDIMREEVDSGSEGTPSPPAEVAVEDRDPTMPQFRPNSAPSAQPAFYVQVPNGTDSDSAASVATSTSTSGLSNVAIRKKHKRKAKDKMKNKEVPRTRGEEPIPRRTLIEWKLLDMAERQAAERGGWGKLSYDEFEKIYRTEESMSNRLDYLGSWIDFCIP